MPGFLFFKSQDQIIAQDSVTSIYLDEDDELVIEHTDGTIRLEGKEAQEAYKDLLKNLPDLIVIGK